MLDSIVKHMTCYGVFELLSHSYLLQCSDLQSRDMLNKIKPKIHQLIIQIASNFKKGVHH